MREIRQSGSEGGGNEQTVSPYPYLCLLLINQKQESHGTLSMGFEVIQQPKSRCILFPWLFFCLGFLFPISPKPSQMPRFIVSRILSLFIFTKR